MGASRRELDYRVHGHKNPVSRASRQWTRLSGCYAFSYDLLQQGYNVQLSKCCVECVKETTFEITLICICIFLSRRVT